MDITEILDMRIQESMGYSMEMLSKMYKLPPDEISKLLDSPNIETNVPIKDRWIKTNC